MIVLISLAVLIISLIALQVTQGRLASKHHEFSLLAQDYAENALQAALSYIEDNPKYGLANESVVFETQPGDPANSQGRVSFDKSLGDYSVNNIEAEVNGIASNGKLIPPQTVHLVGVGQYGGVRVRMEWFVGAPHFPYALASTGALKTSGAFVVGSLDGELSVSDLTSGDFLKKLKSGSLLSNSAANPAVELRGSPVRVTGDVTTPGKMYPDKASLGRDVVVSGLVQEGHRPVSIPKIKIEDYDPQGKPRLLVLEEEQMTGDKVHGFARRQGNLVVNGPLDLQEAIVYVDGDLTVNGPLAGIGAVFCTGRLTIGSAGLGSLRKVALVSRGDLTITGKDKENSIIRGMLVSEGNLSLSDVTVYGAVLAAGAADKTFTLKNVNAIKCKDGVAFTFDIGFSGPTETTASTMATPANPQGKPLLVRLKPKKDEKTGEMRTARPNDFFNPDGTSRLTKSGQIWTMPDNVIDDFFEVINPETGQGFVPPISASSQATATQNVKSLIADLAKFAGALHETSDTAVQHGEIDLNLNRFLKLSEKLRVLYQGNF